MATILTRPSSRHEETHDLVERDRACRERGGQHRQPGEALGGAGDAVGPVGGDPEVDVDRNPAPRPVIDRSVQPN
jgi:hypothetical protein